MYINQLRPRLLQPTARQQVARAARLHNKERGQVKPLYVNPIDYYDKIERRVVRRPVAKSRVEMTALNVSIKLINVAFSRYADGHTAEASRRIPAGLVIGRMSHEAFAAMVKEYAKKYVQQKSKVFVTQEDGHITLRIAAKEPKIMAGLSGDMLFVSI